MHVRTILNRFHRIPGFVFGIEHWSEYEDVPALLVPIRPRADNKPICSGCGDVAPGYDTLKERYFRFVPFWGIVVFLVYAMRRVNCPRCGVKVERVPWAEGKRLTTTTFDHFVAHWCKFLSWTEAAAEFRVSWRAVFRCVEAAVEWGKRNVSRRFSYWLVVRRWCCRVF